MVFKKPYAFFIKYFKLINLILCLFNMLFIYKLNSLHNILRNIYYGKITNFTNLDSTYLGYVVYLLIIVITFIVFIIILTLRKKQKPYKDYLFNLIYNLIIFIYVFTVSNLFMDLSETVVEQTTLKIYSDISLIIILPLLYFLIKYILIIIGFDVKKFNFKKDIVELKQTDEDSEEIELIFDKNTYKAKRKIRKTIRELKYYVLENKLLVSIIIAIPVIILLVSLFSINIFDKNKVSVGENFTAGNFTFKILDAYETKFDSRYKVVKDGSKFVIVNVNVRNNMNLSTEVDFKRIRLFYGDEYVYSNSFYNQYFNDFSPYAGELLKSGENNVYSFIFKIPETYKSNKYVLKIYDKISYNDDELIGNYKIVKIKTDNIDKNVDKITLYLNENTYFDKKLYGKSNLTINNYSIENNYIYNNDGSNIIIRDQSINNVLLILDYQLELDENSESINYLKDDKQLFENHASLEYKINGVEKNNNKLKVIDLLDGKVFIGVPYNIKSAESIKLNINFRNKKITYNIK